MTCRLSLQMRLVINRAPRGHRKPPPQNHPHGTHHPRTPTPLRVVRRAASRQSADAAAAEGSAAEGGTTTTLDRYLGRPCIRVLAWALLVIAPGSRFGYTKALFQQGASTPCDVRASEPTPARVPTDRDFEDFTQRIDRFCRKQ